MFKWLARMFTIPAAVRHKIDGNPLVQTFAPAIYADIMTAVDASIAKNISDPTVAAAVKTAIGLALEHVGIKPSL